MAEVFPKLGQGDSNRSKQTSGVTLPCHYNSGRMTQYVNIVVVLHNICNNNIIYIYIYIYIQKDENIDKKIDR